jgi:hypothetical protein
MEQLSRYYDLTEEATTSIETLHKLLLENVKAFDLLHQYQVCDPPFIISMAWLTDNGFTQPSVV